jgi:WhiB family redox-sensing transcriptional regulator
LPKYDQVDWDNAACIGIYTDLFYSVEEERSVLQYQYINTLRSICAACPIWRDCLTYAFANEQYGVWGALTSMERIAIKDPTKNPHQRRRALLNLHDQGISFAEIQECMIAAQAKEAK